MAAYYHCLCKSLLGLALVLICSCASQSQKIINQAKNDDAQAQARLCYMYLNGNGVPKNFNLAFKWCGRSAAQENLWGQDNLGWIYRHGDWYQVDIKNAFNWYKKASDNGSHYAQYRIGMMYERGLVGDRYTKSFEWHLPPQEQGCGFSYFHINDPKVCNFERDHQKAYRWYFHAAYNGNADAMFRLGEIYEFGIGRAKNMERARYWYLWAARCGNDSMKLRVANVLVGRDKGLGGIEESVKIAKSLIGKGSQNAVDEFIDALENERYIFNTEAAGLYWVESRAEHSNADARKNYYQIISKKYDKAKYWHEGEKNYEKTAKKYYMLAKRDKDDEKKQADIEPKENPGITTIKPSICDEVFSHRIDDYTNFKLTQDHIFKNKNLSKTTIKKYRDGLIKKYSGKTDDKLTFHFDAVPITTIVQIVLDFRDSDRESKVKYDGEKVPTVMIRTNDYPENTINIFLEDLGLASRCEGDAVIVSGYPNSHPVFFTTNFISNWSEGIQYAQSLNGNGTLYFEDEFSYVGDVVNGLPNGAGRYVDVASDSSLWIYEGDNFVDGVLTGKGRFYSGKEIFKDGSYIQNQLNGHASIGTNDANGYYIYSGNMKDDLPDGEGEIIYVKSQHLKKYFYIDIHGDYQKSFSYKGSFANGQKHGAGVCGVYYDNKVTDSFDCEFYKNQLIRIGEQSLLPPDADYSTHLEYIGQ